MVRMKAAWLRWLPLLLFLPQPDEVARPVSVRESAPIGERAPAAAPASSSQDFTQMVLKSVQLLSRTREGSVLLEKAHRRWPGRPLTEIFVADSVSRTDAVLTRLIDIHTGQEKSERQVTVHLRSSQSFRDFTLDLSHELTHATTDPNWDPYDPNLTAVGYIAASIDGPGGEVEAVSGECQVAFELQAQFGTDSARCKRYRRFEGHPGELRAQIRADFYRVGKWWSEIRDRVGPAGLPLLSREPAVLFSSTGHSPYPAALYEEYLTLTRLACENSRHRLERLADDRSPAADPARDRALRTAALKLLDTRCRLQAAGRSAL